MSTTNRKAAQLNKWNTFHYYNVAKHLSTNGKTTILTYSTPTPCFNRRSHCNLGSLFSRVQQVGYVRYFSVSNFLLQLKLKLQTVFLFYRFSFSPFVEKRDPFSSRISKVGQTIKDFNLPRNLYRRSRTNF